MVEPNIGLKTYSVTKSKYLSKNDTNGEINIISIRVEKLSTFFKDKLTITETINEIIKTLNINFFIFLLYRFYKRLIDGQNL